MYVFYAFLFFTRSLLRAAFLGCRLVSVVVGGVVHILAAEDEFAVEWVSGKFAAFPDELLSQGKTGRLVSGWFAGALLLFDLRGPRAR